MTNDILTIETYEEMIHAVGEGLIFMDDQGFVRKLNEQAEKMLGLSKDKVLDRKLVECSTLQTLDGKVVPTEKRPFMRALLEHKKITYSGAYLHQDQSSTPVRITVAPVIHNEIIIGTIAVLIDISAELEAEKVKDEYLSLVSHQLRTPLTSLQWYIELLQSKCSHENQDVETCLHNVSRINKNMVLLVNRLLNITRIESGRLVIHPEPIEIVELINETIEQYADKINEKQQIIDTHFQKGIPSVNLDKSISQIVIDNLITNAMKYSPEGTTIRISVVTTDNEIIVQVKDQGIGIPESEQSKIFTKFYRASNTQTNHTDGTGVGIYMTKKIIEMTGGKIWFTSKENQGTSFFVSFPLHGHKAKQGEVTLS